MEQSGLQGCVVTGPRAVEGQGQECQGSRVEDATVAQAQQCRVASSMHWDRTSEPGQQPRVSFPFILAGATILTHSTSVQLSHSVTPLCSGVLCMVSFCSIPLHFK